MFSIDKSKATDVVTSAVQQGGGASDKVKAGGVFHVQCHDADGNLKWSADAPNLVMNGGLQDMNAKYFTGSSYTATWYLGLYGAAASNTPAAGDTMASHAGWTEQTGYSQATRPACTFGTATTADPSVITNSLSAGHNRWRVPDQRQHQGRHHWRLVLGRRLCSPGRPQCGVWRHPFSQLYFFP